MDRLAHALLRVRPAPLASLLKHVLGVRRREIPAPDGARFHADPASHFGDALLSHGCYEPELTAVVRTLVRPGDLFVDVGANEGYFSVMAGKAQPLARIICIEPQSRLHPAIEKNLQLNALTNITLCRLALAAQDGERTLYLAPDTNTGSSGLVRPRRWGFLREKVGTTTLDRILATSASPRARLVKIDCEGAELEILQGAERALRERAVDFLSVDYHPAIRGEDNAREIDAFLRGHGYRVSRAANGVWLYHLPGLETALAPLGAVTTVAEL